MDNNVGLVTEDIATKVAQAAERCNEIEPKDEAWVAACRRAVSECARLSFQKDTDLYVFIAGPRIGSSVTSAEACMERAPSEVRYLGPETRVEGKSLLDGMRMATNGWKYDFSGIGGLALGYGQRRWQGAEGNVLTTHGLHFDMPLVWSKLMLPLVSPSLTVEADLGFPNVAFSAGVGPGIHFLFPGLLQLYGKVMFDGHLASLEPSGHVGASLDAVAGAAIGFGLTLYGEGRFRIAGIGDDLPGGSFSGFSAGLRFVF